jgi:hypothetical protein
MKNTELLSCRSATDVMMLFGRMRGKYQVQELLLMAVQLYSELYNKYEPNRKDDKEKKGSLEGPNKSLLKWLFIEGWGLKQNEFNASDYVKEVEGLMHVSVNPVKKNKSKDSTHKSVSISSSSSQQTASSPIANRPKVMGKKDSLLPSGSPIVKGVTILPTLENVVNTSEDVGGGGESDGKDKGMDAYTGGSSPLLDGGGDGGARSTVVDTNNPVSDSTPSNKDMGGTSPRNNKKLIGQSAHGSNDISEENY